MPIAVTCTRLSPRGLLAASLFGVLLSIADALPFAAVPRVGLFALPTPPHAAAFA